MCDVVCGLECISTHTAAICGPCPEPKLTGLRIVNPGLYVKHGEGMHCVHTDACLMAGAPCGVHTHKYMCSQFRRSIVTSGEGTEDGALFIETFVNRMPVFRPAIRWLSPATAQPWFLLSELPPECFTAFDAVGLYGQMAQRAFMPGVYDVQYIHVDPKTGATRCASAKGLCAVVAQMQQDVCPATWLGEPKIRFNLALDPQQDRPVGLSAKSWVSHEPRDSVCDRKIGE